jgi:hypothetical protein
VELRTHTNLWQVEKRLYKVYDIVLPVPVSIRQLAVVFAVGVPWLMFMKIIGVPFSPPFGHLVWLAPPAIVAWWANKPVAEGKRLIELLGSQVRYLRQPSQFARLTPLRAPALVNVYADIWRPSERQPHQAAPTAR